MKLQWKRPGFYENNWKCKHSTAYCTWLIRTKAICIDISIGKYLKAGPSGRAV